MAAGIGKYKIIIQACVRKNDDPQDNLAHNAVEIQVLQGTIQQMKSEDCSKRKLLKLYKTLNTPEYTSWNNKQSRARGETARRRPKVRDHR